MLGELERDFASIFGHMPQSVIRAPGRVNLIGEHTDYNYGYVLPAAIEYQTLVGCSPREDSRIAAVALDLDSQRDEFALGVPLTQHPDQQWSNYLRGVVDELQRRGHPLTGCNLAISGNVPQGAGLSSSAALEVAVAHAITGVSGIALSPLELAKVGRDAENNFAGCSCGIMDQLISVAGIKGHAVAIDCLDLSLTPVPLPPSLSMMIVNSNVKRGLVESEYNTRRIQCESAAAYFGKSNLREVSLDMLEAGMANMDPAVARRALHVLNENQRVLEAVEALRENDVPRLSRLMAASHASMRDLFEITTPEIDTLVRVLSAVIGERGGVRMTGGGFGGCVIALIESDLVDASVRAVSEHYERETGLEATIYLSEPAAGVSVLCGSCGDAALED